MLTRLLVLCATGCGYQSGASERFDDTPTTQFTARHGYQWRSLYRQEIKTVAVPIFTTRDFSRGQEFQLTKALIEQLEARTPYKVVPRDRADTILEGEIASIRQSRISENRISAVPQEQLVVVSVNFTWKDLRTGRILVRRRNFEDAATYYPTLGEGRFVASQEAAERLALAIVQELQADW